MKKSQHEKQIKIMREHQRKVLRSTLLASGAGLVLVGLIGVLAPTTYLAMVNVGFGIKYTQDDMTMLCTLLTFVGLADIVIAAIILKDRKTL